jgi:hypothetical protein
VKSKIKKSPREFNVNGEIIKDYGKIILEANEMISYKTISGKEFDFVAKDWGFYATPSANKRLINEGFRTALVVNDCNDIYVMAVENNKLDEFKSYLEKEKQIKICWIDKWFRD